MDRSQIEINSSTDQMETSAPPLASRIKNWTSNLIATALVCIIALLCGRQLISYYRIPPSIGSGATGIEEAWPILESCTLEFGDAPFQLSRNDISGSRDAIVSLLRKRCQQVLSSGASPATDSPGKEEQKLIDSSKQWTPLDEEPGQWRTFSVDRERNDQLMPPTVIGIRDNVTTESNSSPHSRMVVWGIALKKNSALEPNGVGHQDPDQDDHTSNDLLETSPADIWTAYVAKRASGRLSHLIPTGAKRTLSIKDTFGSEIIGFSGGEFEDAIAYFKQMAEQQSWQTVYSSEENGDSWHAKFDWNQDSSIQGIQVELNVNHNQTMRGVLMLQSQNGGAAN